MSRASAIIALLQIRDADDLWRDHRLTQEGDPARFDQLQRLALGHPVIQRVSRESERLQT